ncbi:hypothetical protein KCU91_g1845, partial [Aureobasidium melanogenum]
MLSNRSLRSAEQRGLALTDGRKPELECEYCIQLVEGYLSSNKACINPFRKPLDPQADGVVDPAQKSKSPMSLETVLEKLKSNQMVRCAEAEKRIRNMINFCFKKYPKISEIYQHASYFEDAFNKDWAERDDWIMEQARREQQSPKPVESSELVENNDAVDATVEDAHERSDETNSSTQETSSVYEDSQNESSNDDIMKDINQSDADNPEEDESSDDEPPRRPKPYAVQADDLDEDAELKKPVLKNRARKSRIPRQPSSRSIAASFLNTDNKRLLDTDSASEKSTPSSPQQQDAVLEQPAEGQTTTSTQDHAWSAEQGPAKRPRLDPSIESLFESPPQTPTQQPPTQPATQQPADEPNRLTPEEASILERLRPILSDTVTKEIASLTTRITANAEGELTEYLYVWGLLRCNEQEAEFEKVWKAKAMDKVCRIPITLAVEEQVRLALAETVVEQKERFKEELDRDAAAFSMLLSRSNGGSSNA